MVLPKLSDADVKEIQRLLKEGHTCKDLAKKFGVSPSVISRRGKASYSERFIPLETKNMVIRAIQNGYTKAEAAQMYNVPITTVLYFTKGLPSVKSEGNHIIRRNGIELMNRLLRNGCLISDFVVSTVRGLQRNFPMILSARYKEKTFFYLKGREEETIEAYFRYKPEKIINYSAIEELAFLLGVKITKDNQRNLIEKYKGKHVDYWRSRWMIQRRLEDFFPEDDIMPIPKEIKPMFVLMPTKEVLD